MRRRSGAVVALGVVFATLVTPATPSSAGLSAYDDIYFRHKAETCCESVTFVADGAGGFIEVAAEFLPASRTILRGDFDDDGFHDLFAYSGDPKDGGESLIFGSPTGTFVDGDSPQATLLYQPAVGRFSGADQRSDILFIGQHADYLWTAEGIRGFGSERLADTALSGPIVADIDADGDDDIVFYAPGSPADGLWRSAGNGTFVKTSISIIGSYKILVGDFAGGEGDDLLFYAPGTAKDYLWTFAPDGSPTSTELSVAGVYRFPIVGDFGGDGRDDIMWYRGGPLSDFLWTSRGDTTFDSVQRQVNGSYLTAAGNFVGGNDGDEIMWLRTDASDFIWVPDDSGTAFETLRVDFAGPDFFVGEFGAG